MATYTGDFVTSEEFEEIKNILSSRFKLKKNKSTDSNIIESYNIIVSDGKFSMNYFQDKHLIIEGEQMHPYFDQVYQSVDNFLGSNRKPIVKNTNKRHLSKTVSNRESVKSHDKQLLNLSKKQFGVAVSGVIVGIIALVISIISIFG